MWIRILLLTLVGCLGEQQLENFVSTPEPLISGGNKVSIEKIPYQLALEYYENFFCGASIIGEYWALTAAHCTIPEIPEMFKLRSGSSWKETSGKVHKVVEMIRHEDYKTKPATVFDIAVIRVAEDTPLNSQHILELAQTRPPPGTLATVSGWGAIVQGQQTSFYLIWVQVPMMTQEACIGFYKEKVKDHMICAGEPGKSACSGDSGGPLVVDKVQVGVVSLGHRCAGHSPEIYADVAFFRDWILDTTGLSKKKA